MTNFQLMRERLLHRAGIIEPSPALYRLQDLAQSEWSLRFETLMRNRLIMGALRYGLLLAKGKKTYDRVAGAKKRLQQYAATGNLECLVDIANMMLLEFEEGRHPLRHWSDIHGDHCCQ